MDLQILQRANRDDPRDTERAEVRREEDALLLAVRTIYGAIYEKNMIYALAVGHNSDALDAFQSCMASKEGLSIEDAVALRETVDSVSVRIL